MDPDKTILQVQSEIETALQRLPGLEAQLPDVLRPLVRLAPSKGARAQVSLRHARTQRQVKRNAPAESWSPDSGLVSISYDTSAVEEAVAMETPRAEDPARDLMLALARAEQDPQLGFVSLKWFRDTYLPRQGHAWDVAPDARQRVLVEAINRGWILTSKVANPKNPQYPVTAIRVNRPLADVRRILDQEAGFASPFAPITIPGERLSETVLRERR
ncbi:MAG: hypothetical protein AAB225_24150 [Acidobacteriota bacterium]